MEEKKGNKKIKIKIFLSLVIGQSFRSFQLEPPQKLQPILWFLQLLWWLLDSNQFVVAVVCGCFQKRNKTKTPRDGLIL
jgi:hypothetical protein